MELKSRSPLAPIWAVGLVGALWTGPALTDDRQLLRTSERDPYVFVIFDTSGSMTFTAPCSRDQAISDMNPFDAMCTTECPLDTPDCARICPDFGCLEYDFSSTPLPDPLEPTIIRDDDHLSTDVSPSSKWFSRTTATGFFGASYLDDNGTFNCGDNHTYSDCASVTYDPSGSLSVAGDYMVFLWWPEDVDAGGDGVGDTFATNLLVEVEHDDGTDVVVSTVAVDQRFEGGRWSPIGTFRVTPPISIGKVKILNENTRGRAVADAVGWLKVDIPTTCASTSGFRCQQPICNQGECYTPLNSDDPNSKLFQAKQALYEVVDSVPNVHFGFSTFEQDELRVDWKHWLYRLRPGQTLPTLNGVDFLEDGAEEVFGDDIDLGFSRTSDWDCFTAGGFDGRSACRVGFESDVTDPWEVQRARRFPKLGRDGMGKTPVWFRTNRDAAQAFRVEYSPAFSSITPGAATIAVDLEVFSCPGGTCDSNPVDSANGLIYDLVSDYVPIDFLARREPMEVGGFFASERRVDATNFCAGLDQNTDDTADDPFLGYNLRWPTTLDPRGDAFSPRVDLFDLGDLVPFDWEATEKRGDIILRRLAPNTVNDAAATPDFRTATYLRDTLDPADASNPRLRLAAESERPVIAFGSTPLGESLFEFQEWFNPAAIGVDGWSDIAAVEDSSWGCRQKFVLLLTDGLEQCYECEPTCGNGLCEAGDGENCANCAADCEIAPSTPDSDAVCCGADDGEPSTISGCQEPVCTTADVSCSDGTCATDIALAPDVDPNGIHNPCPVAESLFGRDLIKTHVVGFGIADASGSALQCMAENGGTGDPILAQNKDELVAALQNVFFQIEAEQRAFASASIPAIQSTAADKIFLSSFTPINAKSFWPGRIDAFREPLPLTADDRPDVDRKCFDADTATALAQSACHLWDAGEQLCGQASKAINDFRLGPSLTAERRVLYAQAPGVSRPNKLRLFDLPTLPAEANPNLTLGFDAADLAAGLAPDVLEAYETDNANVIDLSNLFGGVIGEMLRIKDIPVADQGTVEGCDTDGDNIDDGYVLGDIFHANPVSFGSPSNFTYFANNINGYRDFARDHAWRRRMLLAATNDGQLHVFDIGTRQVVLNDFTPDPSDTIELFNDGRGRELFAYIPRLALPILTEQTDSTQHVYSLDSTATIEDVFIDPEDPLGAVDPAEREWRTVAIGGIREAGDILLDPDSVPFFKSGYYALDLTQPDILRRRDDVTDPTKVPCPASAPGCNENTVVPVEYLPSCLDTGEGTVEPSDPSLCSLDFPAELWTFTDAVPPINENLTLSAAAILQNLDLEEETYYLDEDSNGIPDLADTWSRPVIGQIQVCSTGGSLCDPAIDGTDLEAVQVAVFGGGMDPRRKGQTEVTGNFLYMVDVETGEVIYKRELEVPAGQRKGSAAADVAVLDINRDGFFDRIYVGTTAGRLYKVDLDARDTFGQLPEIDTSFTVDETQLVRLTRDGIPVPLIDDLDSGETVTIPELGEKALRRITDPAWAPFEILFTGDSPIYHAPAAFFIPELNQYGLAVGTGDREDLWDDDNGEILPTTFDDPEGGLFFVIVDQDFENVPAAFSSTVCGEKLPITQNCIKNIAFDADPIALDLKDRNFLLEPDADPDPSGDKLRRGWVMTLTEQARITNEAFIVAGILIFAAFDPDIIPNPDDSCAFTGTTRAFVVSAENAGPIAPLGPTAPGGSPGNPPGERAIDRFHEIGEFTTAPFIDRTASQNPESQGKTLLDEIDEALAESIRQSLVAQFPRGSRFNKAYSIVVGALRNSTGVNIYATIPIAMYPADWRDQ